MIADAKPNLDVFHHLLYEISRGLRDLALYTIQPEDQERIQSQLEEEGISFLFRPIEDGRVNVFFGHASCINVVKKFGSCPHCELTPEQDFMLGIMLGYDRTKQCERYLTRKQMCEHHRETMERVSAPAPVCGTPCNRS